MTQSQITEIVAAIVLDYPQPMSMADGVAATERCMERIRNHAEYNFDDDHIAVTIDSIKGTIDVRLFETRDLLYAAQ